MTRMIVMLFAMTVMTMMMEMTRMMTMIMVMTLMTSIMEMMVMATVLMVRTTVMGMMEMARMLMVVSSGKSVSLLTGLLFSGHYDHIIGRSVNHYFWMLLYSWA